MCVLSLSLSRCALCRVLVSILFFALSIERASERASGLRPLCISQ